jgi:endonuclease-3
MLSAQTTDKQVNKITEKLFEIYPDMYTMALSTSKEIERYISSVNYFHTKARHIHEMSKILLEKYNGEVPINLNQLLELPGVGYKTANVFLNDLYRANLGIAVDTHVRKTAIKYKLTKNSNPDKIAKDLEKIYPKEDWWKINRYFVLYGRYDFKIDLALKKDIVKE